MITSVRGAGILRMTFEIVITLTDRRGGGGGLG